MRIHRSHLSSENREANDTCDRSLRCRGCSIRGLLTSIDGVKTARNAEAQSGEDSWAKRGHMSCKWPLLLSAQSLAHKFSFWADIGESIPFQRRLRSGEPGRCNRLAALDYDMVKALEPSAWQTLVTVVQKGEPNPTPKARVLSIQCARFEQSTPSMNSRIRCTRTKPRQRGREIVR